MMLFIRTRATDGTNLTQVEIPADYTLYEASYYHYIYTSYNSYYGTSYDSKLKVDGTIVSDAPITNGWWRAFDLYGARIVPGTLHKIEITYEPGTGVGDSGSAGVGTVLVYRTA